ncbi:MAG TPA: phenylalanine--tRNA ligase subunit beta [Burkholderiaceae bacterium]|nr:phenylalanine--tRNA ligase subunit beta [Burkholderiaceae bacterium]
MQFPESWLREFCDPPLTTVELADILTMAGMEVEELKPVAPPFAGVVVAEIVECQQHPNADRLRVCKVNAGQPGLLQIVCGAPNARAGIRVPLATVGAELPAGEDGKPFVIAASRLRGVESFGMLCSARELKLSEDHAGLLELQPSAPIGADVREVLKLDDTIFTLKLTPNLGHALSVFGIAREVAALTGAPLKRPQFTPVSPTHDQRMPVEILAPDLCGRFSGRIVRNVNTRAKTPGWMVERLERCGQRPVTALVDISNYVMFEFGRPSHIFDLDKIDRKLVVRWAHERETLELLNGNAVELDPGVGVIADANTVESLAGIMGGERIAVSDETRNVYVEAAFWWPQAVAGRSRRYNFSTDAGHRFERGVDPSQTVEHIEHITRLILDICGGEAGPMDDQQPNIPVHKPVTLRVARAAKVIGMSVTQAECASVFRRLDLPLQEREGEIIVMPPSWRFDLQIEEDLIEEVIRVLGYERLPDTPPLAPVTARRRPESERSPHVLRRMLADLDYQETINFSFVEERWETELAGNVQPVKVLNPIAAPLSVMRSSLIGSLVHVLRHNLARKADRVRVFEIGRVFVRDASVADGPLSVAGLRQPQHLAGLAYGPVDALQWGRPERQVDFFDVKGDVESLCAPLAVRFSAALHPALHPGRSAVIELDGARVGVIGELHPKWRQAYELSHAPVLFEIDLPALTRRPLPHFHPIPRQQPALRDFAVVVRDTVSHDAVLAAIRSVDPLIRSVRLFDLYKPPKATPEIAAGERSLAVRVELLDEDITLTDERIEPVTTAIIDRLRTEFSARLRG